MGSLENGAPDQTTFDYLKDVYMLKGAAWYSSLLENKQMQCRQDEEINFDASDIEPMITYGTNRNGIRNF
jgi:3-isopropylmalate/(R)-2-methylmalate dehydratase large subunit